MKKIKNIAWEDTKDELYTYFGKCPCGNTSVIVGSKYCSECGELIANPLITTTTPLPTPTLAKNNK